MKKGFKGGFDRSIALRRTVLISILIALAMVLSYLEALVPPIVPIPGVKLGLANCVSVFALYSLGAADSSLIGILRVCLSALLFGNAVGLAYSLSGAFLSLLMMVLVKRMGLFSTVGVSVVGGVCHNLGQVLCAMAIMETAGLITYLAPLLISGTVAGVGIGVLAGIISNKTKKQISGFLGKRKS